MNEDDRAINDRIQRLVPFAVENIKRHGYPTTHDELAEGLQARTLVFAFRNREKHLAWGDGEYYLTLDGEIVFTYFQQPEPYLTAQRLQIRSVLRLLQRLSTELMRAPSPHPDTPMHLCIKCIESGQHRKAIRKFPPGYPLSEIHPDDRPRPPRKWWQIR